MILYKLFLPLRVVGKTNYRPYMTFFITVGMVAVFLWEVLLTSSGGMPIDHYLADYAFNTCEIGQAPVSELVTDGVRGLFMNVDLTMFLINMLFLWIFSPLVEQYFGRRNFLIYYLTTGLAGYFFAALMMSVMGQECGAVVEPNAAISGVIAGFVFLHPGKRIETALRPFLDRKFDFPAAIFAVIYLLLQFAADGGGPLSGEFLPVWDEVGGFTAGFLIIFVYSMFNPPPKVDPLEHLDS
jgi:membrane associated rhomboid family serine protease